MQKGKTIRIGVASGVTLQTKLSNLRAHLGVARAMWDGDESSFVKWADKRVAQFLDNMTRSAFVEVVPRRI